MKRIPSASSLRRAVPVALIVALALTMASCVSSTKKYGCPNHLQSSVSVR